MYDAMRVEKVDRPTPYDPRQKLIRVLIEDTNFGVEVTFETHHYYGDAHVVGLIFLSAVRPDTNEPVELELGWRKMAMDAALKHIASEMEWGPYGEF